MSNALHSDTVLLHASSQSDMDEIENLIQASVQAGPTTVLPARLPAPPQVQIPVSSSHLIPSSIPPPPLTSSQKPTPVPAAPLPPPVSTGNSSNRNISNGGFGSAHNTLTEPVCDTVNRDLCRIVSNLKLGVFPNPFREDPGKALRDWDLWGPLF